MVGFLLIPSCNVLQLIIFPSAPMLRIPVYKTSVGITLCVCVWIIFASDPFSLSLCSVCVCCRVTNNQHELLSLCLFVCLDYIRSRMNYSNTDRERQTDREMVGIRKGTGGITDITHTHTDRQRERGIGTSFRRVESNVVNWTIMSMPSHYTVFWLSQIIQTHQSIWTR